MLVALLTLTTASHVVTGTIMWVFKRRLEFTLWLVNVDLSLSLLLTFFNSSSLRFNTLTSHATCSVAWGIITALILFVVALPKSFHEFSFLAFIDFASIVGAVLITIIATGVSRESNVEWHAFLPEGQRPDLQGAFLAVTVSRCHLLSRFQDFTDLSPYLSEFVEYCVGISLVSNFCLHAFSLTIHFPTSKSTSFAFAYIQVLPSFVAELKDPNEYMKAITLTVSMETVVYALTGSLIYVSIGFPLYG